MVGIFEELILTLDQMGVLDVMLPFFLVFTLVFAVLEKAQILGHRGKRYNSIIAAVIGFSVVVPHIVGGGPDVVPIINAALPRVSVVLIGAIMVLILMGVFGHPVNVGASGLAGWASFGSFIVVTYIFLVSAGLLNRPPAWLAWILNSQILGLAAALLAFFGVFWFITRDTEHNDHGNHNNGFFDRWGGVYGGGGHGNGGHHP